MLATINIEQQLELEFRGFGRSGERPDRAWVIRNALTALPLEDAARLRERLEGIARRPGQPSTSEAAAMAAQFQGLIESTPRVDDRWSAQDHAAQAADGATSGVTA